MLSYVVNGHQSTVRPADLAVGILQTFKSLGGGHLVHKVSVYIPGVSARIMSRDMLSDIPI